MQNFTASQLDPVVDSVQHLFSNRTYLDLFVVGFTIAITVLIRYASASNGLKLPPGPAPSFIVGNMNDIPVYEEWHTLNQWAKRFGRSSRCCSRFYLLTTCRVQERLFIYVFSGPKCLSLGRIELRMNSSTNAVQFTLTDPLLLL